MKVTKQDFDEMTRAIVQAVAPERIILFGSRARGERRSDSDVDLLVVESKPFGPGRSRRQEIAHLSRVLARFRIPHDVLVYSHDEVEFWRHSINHVIGRALREGRLLYERH